MRIRINFASRDYVLARKTYLALLAGIAACLLLLAYNYAGYTRSVDRGARLIKYLKLQERQDADARARFEEIKKRVREQDVKAAQRAAKFANAAIARRAFSWTTFLNRLEEVVPDGVGIKTIKPNFDTLDVDISGAALDMDPLMEFMDKMTKSPYFEDIPPVLHTSQVIVDKDIGKTLQEFNFKIRYYPEGRAQGAEQGKGQGIEGRT